MSTAEAAEALAGRILTAFDWLDHHTGEAIDSWRRTYRAADRERVDAALAGLHAHRDDGYGVCVEHGYDEWDEGREVFPCPDARRYYDELRRIALVYGVES